MSRSRLEQECLVYGRYLVGQAPDAYVVRKYVEYHSQRGAKVATADAFDRFLTDVSARGPVWTRLAAVYAGRFCKQSALRRKLVLMLALLECSRGSFESLDRVGRGGLPAAFLRLAWHAAVFAAALPVSILLFLPVQGWTAIFAKSGKVPAMES